MRVDYLVNYAADINRTELREILTVNISNELKRIPNVDSTYLDLTFDREVNTGKSCNIISVFNHLTNNPPISTLISFTKPLDQLINSTMNKSSNGVILESTNHCKCLNESLTQSINQPVSLLSH